MPDEKYYQNLIAKAILFRRTEKLVSQQQYGGYRANIVTYTLALISYKTAQRINLGKIWKEQALSSAIEKEIVRVSQLVHDYIIEPPGGANVSEWCKKEKCWEDIKNLTYEIGDELQEELVEVSYSQTKFAPTNSIESLSEKEQETIDTVANIPAEKWFALSKWAKETGNFQPWLRSMLFTVGTLVGRGKTPSIKQAQNAIGALQEAEGKGFSGQ